MKKIFLGLMISLSSLTMQPVFADVACALGQTCQMPINEYGNIQPVDFEIPSPWSDPIGQFSCQYFSSDSSLDLAVFLAATQGSSSNNWPAINSLQPGTSLPINANVPNTFSAVWSQPGQPHTYIYNMFLQIFDEKYTHADPNTQIYVSCKKI